MYAAMVVLKVPGTYSSLDYAIGQFQISKNIQTRLKRFFQSLSASASQRIYYYKHTSSPNFFFGGGDLGWKWKSARKIFGAPPAFFSLWRHWKPLKNKRQIFEKRDPKNFSPAPGFFSKSPRSILRKSSVKVGGSKTYFTPPMMGYVF